MNPQHTALAMRCAGIPCAFQLGNGVRPSTIFQKLCLNTGDVVTKVNQTSLTQPDQGFTFYEVFQNESEIRIEYLKGGNQAAVATITVEEG